MRAILSTAPGGPETLVMEEVAAPVPGPGQALIEVKAVGMNFPDALIIEDQYQFKPPRPFAPGGEVAGVVISVGHDVSGVAPGDRVAAFLGWGGLQEQVLAQADTQIVKLPDAMPFEEAAGLILTYGTSYYALKNRAQLQPGESLLVLGAAGGVGVAAVEIGKAMGARVIAAASSRDKLDFALAAGADAGFVYPTDPLDKDAQKKLADEIKTIGNGGVDVVFDAVGGDYSEPAVRAMNWDGRFLVIGFPAGIARLPLNLTLLKSCQILGVFWGAFAARDPGANSSNIAELLDLYTQGKVRPRVSRTFPFDQAGEAIAELRDRKAMGKLVVTL